MKKLISIVFCIILLCGACSQQSTQTAAVTIQTESVIHEPTPSTHSQGNAYQPDLTRIGYYSEDPKILSGSHLTKQNILALGDVLQTMKWESLAKVFADFDIVLEANCDIRMCDLTHFDIDNYKINIKQPSFYETNKVACISISSISGYDEIEYVITFIQNQDNNFTPCSIITLSNDYYSETPHYNFEEIGGRLWLIWKGGLGHGTGFYCSGEKWYDVEAGQKLLSFTTDYSHTWDYEWLEDFTQKTQLSHEAVMQGSNGDFYIEAKEETIVIPKGSVNGETYSNTYDIFFYSQQMKMHEQGDQWRQMLDHFTQSKIEYIHDWAQEKIRLLDNPVDEEVMSMPDKNDMFGLQNTEGPAFSFMQLDAKGLSQEQLYSLCEDINTQKHDSLFDIFIEYGIIKEDNCELYAMPWNDLQDVSCVIDNRTAYEREIYVNINYTYQNKRKGVLLISVLNNESDNWCFSEALMYSLSNGGTVSIDFLGLDRRVIYIPGEDRNGNPSTEACFQSGEIKFFYVSESYDADGLHYICDLDRHYDLAINEFCKFYVNVKEENDDSIAYITTHIWLPPDSGALFSEDKDLDALFSGDFERHDGLMTTLAE